jgi:hypothetical protein
MELDKLEELITRELPPVLLAFWSSLTMSEREIVLGMYVDGDFAIDEIILDLKVWETESPEIVIANHVLYGD